MDSQHAVRRNESFEEEKRGEWDRKKTFPSLLELLEVSFVLIMSEEWKRWAGENFTRKFNNLSAFA